jgi:predicted flap endonuclease-1-like 5' DNA nuclease
MSQDDAIPRLGAPANRALAEAGYTTLSDVARAGERDLLALHGVGPKAIRLLREAFAERGLTFADEKKGQR